MNVSSDSENEETEAKSKETLHADITRNLNMGHKDDIISFNGHLQLTRKDYRSLTGKNHINDKIVDEYLHLIQVRNMSVYSMPVYAYTWLNEDFEKNFPVVSGWIKEDLEEKETILVPINCKEHWSLVTSTSEKIF